VTASLAIREGLFRPLDHVLKHDASEVYSMPSFDQPDVERRTNSVWALCMGLLSQGTMSLPVQQFDDGNQSAFRPIGTDVSFLNSFDFYDLDSVAALVRNITSRAAAKSPFIWHKARRHAPTPSGVCSKKQGPTAQQAYGTKSRQHISAIAFQAKQQVFQVRADEGLSFPLHGFSWGMMGYQNCLCGSSWTPGTCKLSDEACGQRLSPCMQALCNQSFYSLEDSPSVWECLHSSAAVRCPELGPSDSWGLFPADCTNQECQSMQDWVGNAHQDTVFEGMRFLTEGRSGLKLPNYKFVNDSFHETIHYGAQQRPASDYQLPLCFDASSGRDDEGHDTSVDDWVKGLFPALQVMFDSPVVSYCSRFVIETARVTAFSRLNHEAALQDATQQALLWKSKCDAKIRHLSSCSGMATPFLYMLLLMVMMICSPRALL